MMPDMLTYKFGEFLLDVPGFKLLRDGSLVPLPPKAFDTLVMLVQNHGQVVEKEVLLRELWPDTFVGEAALAQNILTLRRALGQRAKQGHYIDTVPKRGYRFVAPVVVKGGPAAAGAPAEGAAGVVAKAGGDLKTPSTSLAVLPLVNVSNDPQIEYISDGVTETITYRLSRLAKLRVMACTTVAKYKGVEVDPLQAGRELKVQAALVGKINQVEERLVLSAELVDVEHGWQLWGEQYNCTFSDIFQVQDEIARSVSEKLHLKPSKAERTRLTNNYTRSVEAYREYLKGRYFWNRVTEEGYDQAIEHFNQAIGIDPAYALAYTGLADAYIMRDFYGIHPPAKEMSKARSAALKALEIDPFLAEARCSLACLKLIYDFDWAGAEHDFKEALELNPHYTYARRWYSRYLIARGYFDESIGECNLAIDTAVFDPANYMHAGWNNYYARRYDEAARQLRKSLELDPEMSIARMLLGVVYLQQGKPADGIAQLDAAMESEHAPIFRGFAAYAHGQGGQRKEAERILADLERQSSHKYVPPYAIAIAYAGLGKTERALDWLEDALHIHNQWIGLIKVAPEIDILRTDPRLEDIIQRLGLNH
jgi:TolB-like protein